MKIIIKSNVNIFAWNNFWHEYISDFMSKSWFLNQAKTYKNIEIGTRISRRAALEIALETLEEAERQRIETAQCDYQENYLFS